MRFESILLPLATAAVGVDALGINCRGSANCMLYGANVSKDMVNLLNGVDPNHWYNNGQQIACNTGGWQGQKAKELAYYITEHGCLACGSVPTGFPGSNDVAQGELTFNYVSNPCTGFTEGSRRF
ncbi:Kp4 domain-containing protein [Fusarium falciforme]|uniref:Kp4 domain-containing protein n=1 Tax=Fusarium falciforme TaxID=195108 RepID=UPI00230133B2|nr:Kp4 domain-containing protein [Fusarium falciforme]WAO91616.1 Kp4 domain-containing protein [Fusarium falciforme]